MYHDPTQGTYTGVQRNNIVKHERESNDIGGESLSLGSTVIHETFWHKKCCVPLSQRASSMSTSIAACVTREYLFRSVRHPRVPLWQHASSMSTSIAACVIHEYLYRSVRHPRVPLWQHASSMSTSIAACVIHEYLYRSVRHP